MLLIVGLLLGGLVMPLSARVEQQRVRHDHPAARGHSRGADGLRARQRRTAMPGDAGQQRPCIADGDGLHRPSTASCRRSRSRLPGARNDDQLLLDAWGNPIRYSVTASDADGDGNWDFVRPGRDAQRHAWRRWRRTCASARRRRDRRRPPARATRRPWSPRRRPCCCRWARTGRTSPRPTSRRTSARPSAAGRRDATTRWPRTSSS